mmetsp:Transcript_112154/g.350642  ORF Transcript_112154/g.350642 Transcript_112154/m.350642 type:complete len:238 (+) Transcript_112154:73-786(+)
MANEATPLLEAEQGGDGDRELGFLESQYRLSCKALAKLARFWKRGDTEAEQAETAKEGLRYIEKANCISLAVGVVFLLLLLAWDVYVLYTTEKDCNCKANIRLFVKVHVAILVAWAINIIHGYRISLTTQKIANESVDETMSSGTDSKEFYNVMVNTMQAKYAEVRCPLYILWGSYAFLIFLNIGHVIYGMFCLYLAFGACCMLLYTTCILIVVLFGLVGLCWLLSFQMSQQARQQL